jgi:zinc protease
MQTTLRITLLGLALLAGVAHAQSKTAISTALAPETPLAVDPALTYGKLDNGLTFYIHPNAKPEKHLELRLVINAGSILENDDQRGLAHFIEHMAFNGSRHFPKNELVSYLQTIGVKFGADLNAYTSFDETVYMLPLPTKDPRHVEQGFQVLADWAGGLSLDPAEIEKERGVVIEEARARNTASMRTLQKLLPKLMAGSRYPERLPIGSVDVIKNASMQTIQAFYRDWYRPDLMAIVVVGDIDPARAKALIETHFAGLKNPASPRPRERFSVPAMSASQALIITDRENTSTSLQLFGASQASQATRTLADYRRNLARSIVFGALNQRLGEVAQQSNPPFINAGTGIGGLVRGQENFQANASINNQGTAPALKAVIAEVERMRRFGITEAELGRAKSNLSKAYSLQYQERDKTQSAGFVQDYISHFLQQSPISGIANEWLYAQQLIPALSLSEVNALAAEVIPAQSTVLAALMAPEKTDFALPAPEALSAQVTAAYKQPISAYQEKVLATNLLATPPQGGKVIKKRVDKSVGITTLEFANGTKVLLKPTDFKNDQILLSGSRNGGSNHYPVDDTLNVAFSSMLSGVTGLAGFTPTDLPKLLAGKAASMGVSLGAYKDGVSGSSSKADLETMLQLLYLQFTDVRKDPALFATFSEKVKPLLRDAGNNPNAAFNDFYLKALFNQHPRAGSLPTAAQINAISFERSYAINRERFSNARGFSFVMVGSFDIDQVQALLTTYIGGLPSEATAPAGFVDTGMRPISTSKRVEFARGKEPKSTTVLSYNGESARYDALESLKLGMLEEILDIKLTESLREKMSGVYSVSVGSEFNDIPYPNHYLKISIPSAPESVAVLVEAAKNEVAALRAHGPNAADLAKVKENFLTKLAMAQKENSYWLTQISAFDYYDRKLKLIPTFSKALLDKITVENLQQAAERYLDPERVFEATLKPEPVKPEP